jgi:chemotaxis signal transduction protein
MKQRPNPAAEVMTRVAAPEGASGHGAEERSWLVFRLGPHVMCASTLDVEGIVGSTPVTRLPFTPDYVLGTFMFRDRVASAISLRRKLDVRSGEDSARGPFIVARVGDELAAFWVDEVKDVIAAHDTSWQAMPDMLRDGVFDRYTITRDELILHTSFAALLAPGANCMPVGVAGGTLAPAAEPNQAPRIEAGGAQGSEGSSPIEPNHSQEDLPRAPSEQAGASAGEPEAPAPQPAADPAGAPASHDVPPRSPPAPSTVRPRGATVVRLDPASHRRRKAGRAPGDEPACAESTSALMAAARTSSSEQAHASEGTEHEDARSSVLRIDASRPRYEGEPDSAQADVARPAVPARPSRRALLGAALAIIAAAVVGYALWPAGETGLRSSLPVAGPVRPREPAPEPARPAPVQPASLLAQGPGMTASKDERSDAEAQSAARDAPAEAKRVVTLETEALTVTIERPAKPAARAPRTPPESPRSAAAAKPAPAAAQEGIVHVVVRGDTLWDISRKHLGNPYRYPELVRLSGIRNPNLIHPGDIVRIRINAPRR